jgi:hypothetical protein
MKTAGFELFMSAEVSCSIHKSSYKWHVLPLEFTLDVDWCVHRAVLQSSAANPTSRRFYSSALSQYVQIHYSLYLISFSLFLIFCYVISKPLIYSINIRISAARNLILTHVPATHRATRDTERQMIRFLGLLCKDRSQTVITIKLWMENILHVL